MRGPFSFPLLLAALLGAAAGIPAPAGNGTGYILVEGTVRAVEEVTGPSGTPQSVVVVVTERGERRLLLAPPSVLEATGFRVAPGDRVRARALAVEKGPAPVQKIYDLDRGTRLRLRTYRGVPLWSNAGHFQGCGVERPHPHHRWRDEGGPGVTGGHHGGGRVPGHR